MAEVTPRRRIGRKTRKWQMSKIRTSGRYNMGRFMARYTFSLFLFATFILAQTFAQTFVVKDRNSNAVLTITTVKMFSDSNKEDLPVFHGVVKNVSGERLTLDTPKGSVHKKDGSTVEFTFEICDARWCQLPTDAVREVSHLFPKGSFTPATFDFMTFSVPCESESQQIAGEAQAKKDAIEAQAKKAAAETARRKRLAAEQKRKQAEADARYAKMKGEGDARAAEEQRRLRAACSAIYKKTADTKLKDLTVKEEQQVRACQALNMYPPE